VKRSMNSKVTYACQGPISGNACKNEAGDDWGPWCIIGSCPWRSCDMELNPVGTVNDMSNDADVGRS
jgi:hypothetical protein